MVKNIQKNLTNIVIIIGLVSSIGVGFSKFGKLELTIEQLSTATAPDLSGIETNGFSIMDNTTQIAILQREIQLLNLQLKELKISSSNPLQ